MSRLEALLVHPYGEAEAWELLTPGPPSKVKAAFWEAKKLLEEPPEGRGAAATEELRGLGPVRSSEGVRLFQ